MRRDHSNAILSTDTALLDKYSKEREKNIRIRKLERSVESLSERLDRISQKIDQILLDFGKS